MYTGVRCEDVRSNLRGRRLNGQRREPECQCCLVSRRIEPSASATLMADGSPAAIRVWRARRRSPTVGRMPGASKRTATFIASR